MKSILPRALALAALVAAAGQACAAITLFGRDDFRGARVTLDRPAPNFGEFGSHDRAASAIVDGEPWEVCQDVGFSNRCAILVPGSYPNLAAVGLGDLLSSARPARRDPPPPPPPVVQQPEGDIVFYEHPGFHGRDLNVDGRGIYNFQEVGFNDRASSVIVFEGRWEVCQDAGFNGRCTILRPGRYPDLRAMGMNDTISSVRRVHGDDRFADDRYAPPPQPVYDWRRRPQEFVEAVPVESVHVVYVVQQQQQCWVEQSAAPANARTGGALVGGLIGGILGHQIGDGNRQGATVGGAVVGAVVGSQIARGAEQPQDVTRCNSVPVSQGVDHYDVSYWYHGVRHHVQTTLPPGPTIVVNGNGEPRI